jgi:hypothetical protein
MESNMTDKSHTELRNTYIELYPEEPTSTNTLNNIERILSISLPSDFKAVASFYSGGYLGGISHFEISSESQADNITQKTMEWRNSINLPDKYIAIAEPASSLIVLDTSYSEVLWISSVDASRLFTKEPFSDSFDSFESYGSFFAFLIDRETEENS